MPELSHGILGAHPFGVPVDIEASPGNTSDLQVHACLNPERPGSLGSGLRNSSYASNQLLTGSR